MQGRLGRPCDGTVGEKEPLSALHRYVTGDAASCHLKFASERLVVSGGVASSTGAGGFVVLIRKRIVRYPSAAVVLPALSVAEPGSCKSRPAAARADSGR